MTEPSEPPPSLPPPPDELDLASKPPSRAPGPYSSPGVPPGARGPYSSGVATGGAPAPRPIVRARPRAETRGSFVALFIVVLVLGGGELVREHFAAEHAAHVRAAALEQRARDQARANEAAAAAVHNVDTRIVQARTVASTWFASLSPEDHAAAAEAAMGDGYNARQRIGGSLDEAERHLAAIPAGSPLGSRVAGDRREIEARRGRVELQDTAASNDVPRIARARAVMQNLASLQLAHGCAQLAAWRLVGPAHDELELVCERCSGPGSSRTVAGVARVQCFDGTAVHR